VTVPVSASALNAGGAVLSIADREMVPESMNAANLCFIVLPPH
jgi:hypothetical protein